MSPERTARRAWRALAAAGTRWVDVEAYRLAASLAFYALMSIFPLLLLAIAVLESVLGESTVARGWVFDWLDASSSPTVRSAVEEALGGLQKQGASGIVGLAVGIGGALLGASGVFAELDVALNRIFASERPSTSFQHAMKMLVTDRLWAFFAVLGTMVLLLAASTVGIAFEQIGSALAPPLGMKAASFLMATVLLGAGVMLCIHWVPNVRVAWGAAAAGGFTAAFILQLLRLPFGWIIVRFTDFAAYGVVGSVLVVLTWIYVASAVLLFGASIAAVYNRSPSPHMVLESVAAPPLSPELAPEPAPELAPELVAAQRSGSRVAASHAEATPHGPTSRSARGSAG